MTPRSDMEGGFATCSGVNAEDGNCSAARSGSLLASGSAGDNRQTAEDRQQNAAWTEECLKLEEDGFTSRLATLPSIQELTSHLPHERLVYIPSTLARFGHNGSDFQNESAYEGQQPQHAVPSQPLHHAPGNGAPQASGRRGVRRRDRQRRRALRWRQDLLQLGSNPALAAYLAGPDAAPSQTQVELGAGPYSNTPVLANSLQEMPEDNLENGVQFQGNQT